MRRESIKIGKLEVVIFHDMEETQVRQSPHELAMQQARHGFVRTLTKSSQHAVQRIVVNNHIVAIISLNPNGTWSGGGYGTERTREKLIERIVSRFQ